ncbi:S-formylglutathione hydrolase [Xenorhabdus thuongxuanensis]|uniref:S-formylglutathione hydrolase n=1 Tax=Xenorhabdus thuongxuanensis TaxID=1873484 RepID=A0A1Q5TRF8_9GAMM|nr:S-formylglutathione hydrolase [Xenorhabdus thuongxuanensis]OKP02814.1 tributyrin esterase [Xenorhabdus thuongxuanensis]
MERIEHHACFGGWQDVYQHESKVLDCEMRFAIFLPPEIKDRRLPVLYWLSGLTCTEQNFITKSGVQRYAAEQGIVIVVPDTSPRGDDVADDPAYGLGKGAGFYLNASEHPWASHYRMYDYVVSELPNLIETHFAVTNIRAISGHSMGGHGAMIVALKNPGRYCSVSAFSPIVAPGQVPWGIKAFSAYLGEDTSDWKQYDTVELIKNAKEQLPILIDQGLNDGFLDEQLRPHLLQDICDETGYPVIINLRPEYDHSYYFIASFIEDHITYHTKAMQKYIERK